MHEPSDATTEFHPPWALRGATLHVTTGAPPRRGSFVARGGRLAFVGADEDVPANLGAGERVVDGAGLHVYPGFSDAHGHLHLLGRSLEEIPLAGARSLEDVLGRVRARANALPAGEWVTGRGWGADEWRDAGVPTATALDRAAGGRPVVLWRRDEHSVWVSSEVLHRAGIDRTTSAPAGGRLERDDSGAPTGVLVDHAIALLDGHLPKSDGAAIRRRLTAAQEVLAHSGITGVHDMSTGFETLEALRALEVDGLLALRVYAALDDHDPKLRGDLAAHAHGDAASRLRVRAVKLFADGALNSRGAWLREPYADDQGQRGLALLSPRELRGRLRSVVAAGLQPCIHAIGDAANREVLDAFEEVLGAHHPSRPRIEHAQVVAPEDRPRFAALGVLASMQPVHCTSDAEWARRRLGPVRERFAYAWRSLRDAGAQLAFGSDFPVESHDPRTGLHAAVTRRASGGEAWNAGECISLDDAIAAYTTGAAHARFADGELGAIEPGRLADLTVFDRPLAPDTVLEAGVAATIVGGRVAFAADRPRWDRALS